MKKILIYVLICLLVSASIGIPVAGNVLPEQVSYPLINGNILYVGGSGQNNYTRIQDAVDNAIDGDTVFVYDDSSPYYENIVIEKSITVLGENRETTCILGDESAGWGIVNISSGDVSISGFTIQPNMGEPAGIVVSNDYTYPDYWNIVITQNVSISNNIIKNTVYGIFGIRLKYGNISNNIIEDCTGSGINLFISSNTTITKNFISHCSYRGIEIGGLWGPYRLMNYRNPVAENIIISQNTIQSNRWGIQLNGGTVKTIITQNNIIDNHGMFPGHDGIGIYIYQASKTQITKNNLINNSQNAYFTSVLIIRYPQFVLNTWDGNYWGKSSNIERINGTFWFMPFPRLPVGISFPNFDLTQWEVPWVAFDKHPAQEPYDIPRMT
jgi:parallel beta-helix repeat protein